MSTISVSLILFFLWSAHAASVLVEVVEGWLEGKTVMSATGRRFYSFKGVPYAEPPLGELRFRAPRPPLRWQGIRDATRHGSVCPQLNESDSVVGNENCLFLNVYSPDLDPFTPLPVMVYIHGGNFKMGSGNDDFYAPDFLIDCGVVVVTINYRLGPLGFLSVNNVKAPGNAGLKDQIAAMLWVQRNIGTFGGDPNSVTMIGQSSGGSSITMHMLSPAARGLFHRAIVMSGVYSKDFGIAFMPEKRAFALGRKLGIETSNTNDLINYLQNVSVEDLLHVKPDILYEEQVSFKLLAGEFFMPVVERKFGDGSEQFLTESPDILMDKRQMNSVDLLIGHTALESLKEGTKVAEHIGYFSNYTQFLVPRKISYRRNPLLVLKVADKIKKFYFGDRQISLKTIRNFLRFFADARYVYEVQAFIERLPKLWSERRYMYEFAIYTERNIFSKLGAKKFGIKKATHKDDVGYLFNGSGYNSTVVVDGQIYKYIQLMTTLYTNFAKFGTPTPDFSLGLVWPEYSPDRSYMHIGETGKLSVRTVSCDTNSSMGFWNQLYSSVGINL